MSNIVKTDGGSLASLLHGKGGGLTIPKPYERDIFLFDTFIAGTTHIEGIEELAQYLNVNDKLNFYREPHNRFRTIRIVFYSFNNCGYTVFVSLEINKSVFSLVTTAHIAHCHFTNVVATTC